MLPSAHLEGEQPATRGNRDVWFYFCTVVICCVVPIFKQNSVIVILLGCLVSVVTEYFESAAQPKARITVGKVCCSANEHRHVELSFFIL